MLFYLLILTFCISITKAAVLCDNPSGPDLHPQVLLVVASLSLSRHESVEEMTKMNDMIESNIIKH